MPDLDAIVDWYQSTGLRPYLECIQQTELRQEFLEEFRSQLSHFYAKSEAGGVPFSFRRIFLMAGV
jgi:trans-aconitate 2-methyltransferase